MSKGRRILLVDDESGILDTLRILLRGNGYDVVAALSGREAIEMLPGASPDIVLTDIRMPGLTGLEVMAKAHEIDPETAVILMTAQASLQTAVQAVNEGAYYYLQKPFANEELLAICRRAAEARELRAENKALKKEIRRQSMLPCDRPTGKNRSLRRCPQAGGDGGPDGVDRTDHGGERIREGGPSSLHPPAQRPGRRQLLLLELWGASRGAARERALRSM